VHSHGVGLIVVAYRNASRPALLVTCVVVVVVPQGTTSFVLKLHFEAMFSRHYKMDPQLPAPGLCPAFCFVNGAVADAHLTVFASTPVGPAGAHRVHVGIAWLADTHLLSFSRIVRSSHHTRPAPAGITISVVFAVPSMSCGMNRALARPHSAGAACRQKRLVFSAVVTRVAMVVFFAIRVEAGVFCQASCTVVVVIVLFVLVGSQGWCKGLVVKAGGVKGFGFVYFVLVGGDGRDTGRLVHSLWAKLAEVAGFLALLSDVRPVLRMRAPADSRDVRAGHRLSSMHQVVLVLARWVSGTRGRNGPEGDCGQK
jgi:hypothetical protein